MKILNLALCLGLLTCAANALSVGDSAYSVAVKNISLSADLSDSVGRLMPTNEIKIIEADDKKVKFSLEGYQSAKAQNIIYFTDKARIISVAFSKQAKFDAEVLENLGEYNKVKITAYTSPDALETDLKAIFSTAKKNHEENCGTCHPLHRGETQVANRWPALIKSMQSRTPLSQDEIWVITQYLQKHSKDINVD
ncbi:MAG: cytochrome C [Campylobacter sp.]|nr:cytochrome C [Campylobacter sp.]